MGYYDPPSYVDWEADFYCGKCEKDTPHFFVAQSKAVTWTRCETCGTETELDPDDFE